MNGKIIIKKGLAEKISDTKILEIETGIDPLKPQNSTPPINIVGVGEISTTFTIQDKDLSKIAFKRIPIFSNSLELTDYLKIYDRYIELLEKETMVKIPEHGYIGVETIDGRVVFYDIQQLLPGDSIGNKIIHLDNKEYINIFINKVLDYIFSVWEFNNKNREIQIGLDAQLSNWAVKNFNGDISENTQLIYIDVSTPMITINEEHQLNAELFLKSTPSFLRLIARKFFLSDVLNRYYELHLVLIDIVANLFKEKRADLIPDIINLINNRLVESKFSNIELISKEEIEKYYKEDAFIWSFYLSSRKIDRFITTKLFRKRYEFILPEKVER